MAFKDGFDLSANSQFQERVKLAIAKVAIDVQAEDPSGLAVPKGYAGDTIALHADRSRLAYKVLNEPDGYKVRFTIAIASNAAVVQKMEAATDGDLEFTVASLWNAFSIGGA